MVTMSDVERGRALAALRSATNLTQAQVGAAFGINKQAVSEWERGLSNPGRDRLAILDALYGADGRVLALYGFGTDDVRKLRDEMVELARAVRLLALKAGIQIDLELLRDDANPDDPSSTQGQRREL